ncbi:hypothetical protein [Thermus filiformis]|uniref:Uncharacterized protein n=1 Tax=Thermus filiformis TaxID=276 RepID=A0A0A2WRR1_THEFI|nr:hypothetical protein [Thermus filiformis]KGQ20995.2 hypothetical protein THFILI_09945 [Thermus filiformis]
MYPEWRKTRKVELHLAWLVQGPKGYELLFKINPYSLYPDEKTALEALRRHLERPLDQDPKVGQNKAPTGLLPEEKARLLAEVEAQRRGFVPVGRYALLAELYEVEEAPLFQAPFRERRSPLWSLQGLVCRLVHTPWGEEEHRVLAEGVLEVEETGLRLGEVKLPLSPETPVEGVAFEEAWWSDRSGHYYVYRLEVTDGSTQGV